MRMSDPLVTASRLLLRPRLTRLLLAIALGVLSLGSALALAAVSAWLITRAWQMPPILDLSVAVVAVRALAISRGVLHYCERLVTHDAALRAAGAAREQIYHRLARGPVEIASRLHSGELVARVGSDVDTLSDVLVRALLPIGVAVILGAAATAVFAVISPAAAVVMAVCLLVAGVIAPWLSARAALTQEMVARRHLSDRDVSTMLALEHAPELRLAGVLPDVIDDARRRYRGWGDATDAAAKPAAMAEAMSTAAVGVSVLGALLCGIGIAGSVAPTTLAILMLLPLSAFEATTPLPAAAIQLARSRIAAQRLLDLTPGEPAVPVTGCAPAQRHSLLTPRLAADAHTGHHRDRSQQVTVDLAPGSRLAITGPSGCGKTALLMSLAGLIPTLQGRVTLDDVALDRYGENELRSLVSFFAEDAHVFATTVRDNLLVARGDCTDDELTEVLDLVGLREWLSGLDGGLSTVLTGGAQALSAGQRRRMLLARALLSPARIVLLDEPTEHLDGSDAEHLLRAQLDPGRTLFGPDRTVVVATHHLPAGIACARLELGPATAAADAA